MTNHPANLGPFAMFMKVGLVTLIMFLSSDRDMVVADAAAETCSSGIAVEDPEDNPLLVEDCEALLESRDILSKGGRRLIWTADTSMYKWEGLTIGGSPPRVRGLWLGGDGGANNSLKGSIPASLGRLTGLWVLELDNNGLTGGIPDALGRLTSLHTMDLSRNQLEGGIPDALGRLTSLHTMDLSKNQLEGEILDALGRLTSLHTMDLSRNQLEGGIPDALGRLTSLHTMDLGQNQLEGGIPPALGDLVSLERLLLFHNPLTGEIPTELGRLTNLTEMRAIWQPAERRDT